MTKNTKRAVKPERCKQRLGNETWIWEKIDTNGYCDGCSYYVYASTLPCQHHNEYCLANIPRPMWVIRDSYKDKEVAKRNKYKSLKVKCSF